MSVVKQVVLKVHSRCNLACDYCYMYEHADQRWRMRPMVMSPPTVHALSSALAVHARKHRLPAIGVVLHGGEPLLAGVDGLTHIMESIRAAVSPETAVQFSLQTNGTLLNLDFLDLFVRFGVRVGVSIDGDRAAQDRHRRSAAGTGSYPAVARALALLGTAPYESVFSGVLATIDLANDPVATYESLLTHRPSQMDLLLPHGNWTTPPPGKPPHELAPYAAWLIAVFDRWYGASIRETGIRLFDAIIALLLGGASPTRQVGASGASIVTIETDGSIEGDDALKTTHADVVETGLHIDTHSIDEAAAHPAIAGAGGALAPAQDCVSCPVFSVCGGGLPAHRYRADSGFNNPSVYCADLFALIDHIRRRLQRDLSARAGRPTIREEALC
ncbi:radical SAM protein [Catellatospora citrea]|uniref:Radical SAM protein n=1 Tax=Catellatospora citrea TaxID=53366 RepID=A0A8J3KCN0_9ACTN|nr:FxsB family cyclophane-forming radical SAM/SPASM peptide maturase [Catellatospora citrea]GIF96608.1 radical SAM protein [Catellatospora citrea]